MKKTLNQLEIDFVRETIKAAKQYGIDCELKLNKPDFIDAYISFKSVQSSDEIDNILNQSYLMNDTSSESSSNIASNVKFSDLWKFVESETTEFNRWVQLFADNDSEQDGRWYLRKEGTAINLFRKNQSDLEWICNFIFEDGILQSQDHEHYLSEQLSVSIINANENDLKKRYSDINAYSTSTVIQLIPEMAWVRLLGNNGLLVKELLIDILLYAKRNNKI